MLESITPLIITCNEAPNIKRTLSKLDWARRIVIVDSGSTDGTLKLAKAMPQVEVLERAFDNFASQCNFGLDLIASGWVLSLDADYVVSDELVAEIGMLKPVEAIGGYQASFIYCIHGRPLRGSLYPPRTVLYRAGGAVYHNEGHGHRVEVRGGVQSMTFPIFHDDRKPLQRWWQSQQNYARAEAVHLLTAEPAKLRRNDRIRLMAWPAPILVFLNTLIARGCLFDGWPGWFYALQRLFAETALALEIIERRAARKPSEPMDH